MRIQKRNQLVRPPNHFLVGSFIEWAFGLKRADGSSVEYFTAFGVKDFEIPECHGLRIRIGGNLPTLVSFRQYSALGKRMRVCSMQQLHDLLGMPLSLGVFGAGYLEVPMQL